MTVDFELLKNVVKNNVATFSFYRQGYAYYEIVYNGSVYNFRVEIKDLDTATLLKEHKAIELMRYIRKSMEDEAFVPIKRL